MSRDAKSLTPVAEYVMRHEVVSTLCCAWDAVFRTAVNLVFRNVFLYYMVVGMLQHCAEDH